MIKYEYVLLSALHQADFAETSLIFFYQIYSFIKKFIQNVIQHIGPYFNDLKVATLFIGVVWA